MATAGAVPVETSNLPYTFNPPLHPSLMHVVPDLGVPRGNRPGVRKAVYDETANVYGSTSADSGAFQSLRLGRIVMGPKALSFATQQAGTRYGFRFLYNPTTVNGGSSVGTNFIPDPSNTVTFVLQDGLENFTFELLLNRAPELQGQARASDYYPAISDDEMAQIMERGTHHDLEFLYRVANGIHNTKARTGTGDIGILLPNPCDLFLGPYRSRGALMSISATDQMFSPNMVPMLTYVQITFARYLTVAETEFEQIKASGVKVRGETTTTEAPAGTAGDGSNQNPTPDAAGLLDWDQVYKLAVGAGFPEGDKAKIATRIAFGESSWNPKAKNYIPCYGLWQINMSPELGPGRMKDYGLTSYEDLWIPSVNAHIAFKMWKARPSWGDWDAYLPHIPSSKYNNAPGDPG